MSLVERAVGPMSRRLQTRRRQILSRRVRVLEISRVSKRYPEENGSFGAASGRRITIQTGQKPVGSPREGQGSDSTKRRTASEAHKFKAIKAAHPRMASPLAMSNADVNSPTSPDPSRNGPWSSSNEETSSTVHYESKHDTSHSAKHSITSITSANSAQSNQDDLRKKLMMSIPKEGVSVLKDSTTSRPHSGKWNVFK